MRVPTASTTSRSRTPATPTLVLVVVWRCALQQLLHRCQVPTHRVGSRTPNMCLNLRMVHPSGKDSFASCKTRSGDKCRSHFPGNKNPGVADLNKRTISAVIESCRIIPPLPSPNISHPSVASTRSWRVSTKAISPRLVPSSPVSHSIMPLSGLSLANASRLRKHGNGIGTGRLMFCRGSRETGLRLVRPTSIAHFQIPRQVWTRARLVAGSQS